MSTFSTGEMASLGHVSVRTIQYWDKKGLLTPSTKGPSGRRIYDSSDVQRLKLILLFKNIGLSLSAIKEIVDGDNSVSTLKLLLTERQDSLRDQISADRSQLAEVDSLIKSLPSLDNLSLNSIDDMNSIMDNKKALKKVHIHLILFGLPLSVLEIGSIIYSIVIRSWWPFVIWVLIDIIGAGFLSRYYFNSNEYVCPNCQFQFRPTFWQSFWAPHTFATRKLTCPNCGQKNYCVEVCGVSSE